MITHVCEASASRSRARSRRLKASSAARIRYGILAAREDFEGDRLTPGQLAFLDACRRGAVLMLDDGGTRKPYDREIVKISTRRSR